MLDNLFLKKTQKTIACYKDLKKDRMFDSGCHLNVSFLGTLRIFFIFPGLFIYIL